MSIQTFVDLNSASKKQLKEEAKKRNLKVTGTKEKLLERINAYIDRQNLAIKGVESQFKAIQQKLSTKTDTEKIADFKDIAAKCFTLHNRFEELQSTLLSKQLLLKEKLQLDMGQSESAWPDGKRPSLAIPMPKYSRPKSKHLKKLLRWANMSKNPLASFEQYLDEDIVPTLFELEFVIRFFTQEIKKLESESEKYDEKARKRFISWRKDSERLIDEKMDADADSGCVIA